MEQQNCQVAVYYFPNWHPNEWTEKIFGVEQSEWVKVQQATPRFPGHRQPKVPLWGYENEADPRVMEKKISAAAGHAVDAWIFDWYWWESGPSLHTCLEQGYLQAVNNSQVKFGLMWANHRPVSRATFDQAIDHAVQAYFHHPSYWRVEGGLYFSIYELHTLIAGLGGIDETRRALDSLRQKAHQAGVGEVHLNVVEWGLRNLPDHSFANQNALIETFGFDSVTDYVWVHHIDLPNFPENAYPEAAELAYADWDRFASEYSAPYHPNVTMGWDSWPRVPLDQACSPAEYPATPLITANPPSEFRKALERARNWLEQPQMKHKILTINAWNEWTEGSYLEPDTEHGLGYLEAIRDTFGH